MLFTLIKCQDITGTDVGWNFWLRRVTVLINQDNMQIEFALAVSVVICLTQKHSEHVHYNVFFSSNFS